METTPTQRNCTIEHRKPRQEYQPNEQLVCANCGYYAFNHDRYTYHAKLCSIPEYRETRPTTPFSEQNEANQPNMAAEPPSEPEGAPRSGRYWPRIVRAARAIAGEFGRYSPTSDLYLIPTRQQEPPASALQDGWLTRHAAHASPISHDPYGLISRWKDQQQNGNNHAF